VSRNIFSEVTTGKKSYTMRNSSALLDQRSYSTSKANIIPMMATVIQNYFYFTSGAYYGHTLLSWHDYIWMNKQCSLLPRKGNKNKSISIQIFYHPTKKSHTWLFHALRYPSRPDQTYSLVCIPTEQCPARALGVFSSNVSILNCSHVNVSVINIT
jgi:hypothetical protein